MTLQGVLAEAHHDNTARDFPAAVQLDDSAAHVGTQHHLGDVAQQHRGPGLASDHDRLDVLDGLDVAPAPNHVFPAAEFEQAPLHVIVGGLDAVDDLPDGNPVSRKAVGVDVDLVLLHKAPDAGHLRDALDAGQGVAQIPILKRPQIRQVVPAALVHQGVGIHPADPGRIGSQHRCRTFGKLRGDLLQVFEHPRARPVDVGAVLEDHVDIGEAEIRQPPHGFDLRGGDEGRDDGVGDLVFDQIRAAALPRGVDDHLNIGDVRYGVQRDVLHGVDPGEHQQQDAGKHQEPVPGAGVNDFFDHGDPLYCPCWWPAPPTASLSLDSESIRKLALVTTRSPTLRPSRTS